MRDNGDRESRDLVQLVRFVAGQTRRAAAQFAFEGDRVRIGAEGGPGFSVATLKDALARGLLVSVDGGVRASPTASSFLRRAQLSRETGFQDQHRDLAEMNDPESGLRYRVNRAESPLGAMARLKEKSGSAFLPPEALAAGERLHADFVRAGLQPRLTMIYEPRLAATPRGGARNAAADLSDTALAARERVARAMEAIGPELCGVALDVCCFEKGLETVERERQWPARSAKLMLRTALMALSRHYQPPAKGKAIHRWGAEGYRPDMRDAAVTSPR
ncbi:DUF6456 domain-containing protein [Pararhizobium arenae]|uniref:DUF6456 domain-containing protein n=1 Tax=Pararhizobium arenae TaxID=1856850 RepID=UPI00094AF871|nr:DUF6456 domain-containing protein [Pararhizobium arenae]